ncbi:hypothetical protein [Polaribacter sp. Asnod1-A03]|uniref:hypothetical protein n=1 Tax=Polaribacter sp. Asnod1-A03 TaxID=3160581 RepID=UPI0038699B8B
MEELEKNIIGKGEVKGFLFTQIQQSDKAYLYAVNSYYEVFKKKQKTNSKKHCFPTSKAFGVWAWTYPTYEKAMEKFNHLNFERND